MVSCYDDVRHITDESSAKIHRDRKAVRRGPFAQIDNHSSKEIPPQPQMEPTYESLPLTPSNQIKGTPTSIYQGIFRNSVFLHTFRD
ncbi:unnamed protein product [Protopolystoma xenopodis]|uniref:Uncharacterized protein n=1 Tax=Protopolystoma xenopodis TaxID=117903 RepID=A0A448WBB0_9PLAT|nr:unnamed protein product [Protopolystoma xenopodis]